MIITPEAIQTFKDGKSLEQEICLVWEDLRRYLFRHANNDTWHWDLSRSDFVSIAEVNKQGIDIIVGRPGRSNDNLFFSWAEIHATSAEREAMHHERYKDAEEFN